MKKSFRFLAAAIAIVAAAASCNKEAVTEPADTGVKSGKCITFTATFPETKAGFDNATGAMTWKSGDQIRVFDGANEEIITLAEENISESGYEATFQSSTLESTDNYSAAFPASYASISDVTVVTFTPPEAYEDPAGAFLSYAFGSCEALEDGIVKLTFKPASPLICISTEAENVAYFEIELFDAPKYKHAIIVNSENGDYDTSDDPVDNGIDGLSAAVVDGKAYIPVPAETNASGYKIKAYCLDEDDALYLAGAYVKEGSVSFEQGYFYNVAVDVMENLVVDGLANLKTKLTKTSTDYKVLFSNSIVTYVNGSNAYIEDPDHKGSGSLIFKSGHGLAVGDRLDGLFDVKAIWYSTFTPEITSFTPDTDNPGIITPGATVPVTKISLADLLDDEKFEELNFHRVLLEGVTFTSKLEGKKEADITDGAKTVHVFSKTDVAKADEGAVVNMYCYPTYYTKSSVTIKELVIWEAPEVIGYAGVITPAATSKSVEAGKAATIDVSINSGADISAVSADSGVATASIDNTTGVLTITGVAVGTTTITLSAPAKDTYTKANDVVINVTVTAAGAKSWQRITSVAELLAGGKCIIGYEAEANTGVIVPMRAEGTATTTAAGIINSGTSSEKSSNGTIDMTNLGDITTSVYEVTVVASTVVEGAVCIKIGDNFIGNENTKNNCKMFTAESEHTAFTPTMGTNNVFTLTIAANTGAETNYTTFQYNSGSPRFAVYTGLQKNVVIYMYK